MNETPHSEDCFQSGVSGYVLVIQCVDVFEKRPQIMNMYHRIRQVVGPEWMVHLLHPLAGCSYFAGKCFFHLVWPLLSLLCLHADEILITPAASCCITNLLSAHTGYIIVLCFDGVLCFTFK